jgi:hypothetical protein
VVLTPDVTELNVAGCLAIELGTTGGGGCASDYQAATQCGEAACTANCTGADITVYEQCITNAAQGQCASLESKAACAADAGSASATCLAFNDFQAGYNQIAPLFCGP